MARVWHSWPSPEMSWGAWPLCWKTGGVENHGKSLGEMAVSTGKWRDHGVHINHIMAYPKMDGLKPKIRKSNAWCRATPHLRTPPNSCYQRWRWMFATFDDTGGSPQLVAVSWYRRSIRTSVTVGWESLEAPASFHVSMEQSWENHRKIMENHGKMMNRLKMMGISMSFLG